MAGVHAGVRGVISASADTTIIHAAEPKCDRHVVDLVVTESVEFARATA